MKSMNEAIAQALKRLSELTDEELQSEFGACKGGAVARAFLSESEHKAMIDTLRQKEQQ